MSRPNRPEGVLTSCKKMSLHSKHLPRRLRPLEMYFEFRSEHIQKFNTDPPLLHVPNLRARRLTRRLLHSHPTTVQSLLTSDPQLPQRLPRIFAVVVVTGSSAAPAPCAPYVPVINFAGKSRIEISDHGPGAQVLTLPGTFSAEEGRQRVLRAGVHDKGNKVRRALLEKPAGDLATERSLKPGSDS